MGTFAFQADILFLNLTRWSPLKMGGPFWADSLGSPLKESAQKGPPILSGLHCELNTKLINPFKISIPHPLPPQLREGDTALGYDFETLNFNSDDIDKYPEENLPSVVLIRRFYPNQTARRRKRKWELKHLPKAAGAEKTKAQEAKDEEEMNEFLDELERDEEYRKNVGLYKKADLDAMSVTTIGGDEPRVRRDELLEDIDLTEEEVKELKGDEEED